MPSPTFPWTARPLEPTSSEAGLPPHQGRGNSREGSPGQGRSGPGPAILHNRLRVQSPWNRALGLTVQGSGGRGVTWDTGALLSGLTSGRSELRVDGRHAERETGEDWGGPREAGESHSEHPGGSGSCLPGSWRPLRPVSY